MKLTCALLWPLCTLIPLVLQPACWVTSFTCTFKSSRILRGLLIFNCRIWNYCRMMNKKKNAARKFHQMLQVGDKVRRDLIFSTSHPEIKWRENYSINILPQIEEAGIVLASLFPISHQRTTWEMSFLKAGGVTKTLYAVKRREQDGDRCGFCHEAKSFLTFGRVPCRTITPNGTGAH